MTQTTWTGKNLFSIILLTIICTIFQFSPVKAAEETAAKTVAVLPFAMHASDNLAYLQDGLRDMLASRLAANAGVNIVERSRIDALPIEPGKTLLQNEAQALAGKLAADYVVAGSLTSLGGSVSIDAKVFPADASSEPTSFYASAAQENETIGAINQLSWDIAEKLFGKTRPAATRQAMGNQFAPSAADNSMAPFITAHPDKIYRSAGQGSAMGSPFIVNQGLGGARGFTKTQNFDFAVRAMDVGDVDGDGQDDLVLAGDENIHIFSFKGTRQQELAVLPLSAIERVHGVSVADLNGDGRAEIYVSANENNTPVSFGLEWQDGTFKYLFRKARWYIRVLDIPGEGVVLIGQKAYVDSPVQPGIFRLLSNGDTLQQDQKLEIPDSLNLFDFALADLNGDGSHEIIALTQDDRLQVLNANGGLLWKSTEYYGGSSRYIGELDSSRGRISQTDIKGERIYIPGRIIITDINGDNLPDVIVSRNISTASRLLMHYKDFSSSEIHALSWNGIGLTELWHTRKIDGYVADYQLRQVKNDQGDLAILYAGVALKGGTLDFTSSKESTVLMYNLSQAADLNQ